MQQVAVVSGTWQSVCQTGVTCDIKLILMNLSRPLENANKPNRLASQDIVPSCLELLFCKVLQKQHKVWVSPFF